MGLLTTSAMCSVVSIIDTSAISSVSGNIGVVHCHCNCVPFSTNVLLDDCTGSLRNSVPLTFCSVTMNVPPNGSINEAGCVWGPDQISSDVSYQNCCDGAPIALPFWTCTR